MVMAAPEERLSALQEICDAHDVELCVLGTSVRPTAN